MQLQVVLRQDPLFGIMDISACPFNSFNTFIVRQNHDILAAKMISTIIIAIKVINKHDCNDWYLSSKSTMYFDWLLL